MLKTKKIEFKTDNEGLKDFVKQLNEWFEKKEKNMQTLVNAFDKSKKELRGEIIKTAGEVGAMAMDYVHSDEETMNNFYSWCNQKKGVVNIETGKQKAGYIG